MYKFGPTSKRKLNTCHPKLIKVAEEAIKVVDFSIISGYRGKSEQDRYKSIGASQLSYPDSKHNNRDKRGKRQSLAFDFAPYPIVWSDTEQFTYVAGVIMGIAKQMGIQLRWGNDWDGNGKVSEGFQDYGHIELYERRK